MTKRPSDCPRSKEACAYQARIDDLERDIDQLTHIASHDLREPLMGLMGFATLLKKRCADQLNPECQHFLEQIIDGTKRMEMKLEDLLTFSRAGQIAPSKPFPLGAAVEEARRALVRSVASTGAIILIEGELPIVSGDRSMIAQVFQNLFSNSLKYQKRGEPPIIEIKAEPHEEGWLVSVQDNGIGFDLRHQDRIFGVFQRLYTVDQYPGTGIGLAIAKRIVERHGGRIWPWSEPDEGAIFYFTLPKTRTPARPPA